jgi:hypothetical protein
MALDYIFHKCVSLHPYNSSILCSPRGLNSYPRNHTSLGFPHPNNAVFLKEMVLHIWKSKLRIFTYSPPKQIQFNRKGVR